MKLSLRFIFITALCLGAIRGLAVQTPDEEYENVAEEYMKGYFATRPLEATALGLHEYHGTNTDYSRLRLDSELLRLRRFDDRLPNFYFIESLALLCADMRILQAAIRRELF